MSARKPPMVPTLRARLRARRDAAVAALKVTGGARVAGSPVDTAELDASWPDAADAMASTNPLYLLMLVTWKLRSGKAVDSTKDLRTAVREMLDAAKIDVLRMGGVTYRLSAEHRVSFYGDKPRATRLLRVEYVYAPTNPAPVPAKRKGVNMARVMALLAETPKAVETRSLGPLFEVAPPASRPPSADPKLLN